MTPTKQCCEKCLYHDEEGAPMCTVGRDGCCHEEKSRQSSWFESAERESIVEHLKSFVKTPHNMNPTKRTKNIRLVIDVVPGSEMQFNFARGVLSSIGTAVTQYLHSSHKKNKASWAITLL